MIDRFECFLKILLVLSLTTMACTKDGPPPTAPPATQSESKEPVIALWNDGVHMVHKPFLLFAAWEDGTVIRRVDVSKTMGGNMSIHDWAESKLTIGSVKQAEVLALQESIAKVGFFRPPLANGLIFVDGPSQSLCVRYGKAHRLLSHHGPSDKWLREHNAKLTQTSDPTREDAEAITDMWDKIANLINALVPANAAEYRGERELTPTKPFDATDENGDLSIEYFGVPEYKEVKAHTGTPQSMTIKTTVQVITRDKYQTLKQSGKVSNEERHGDWLYFIVSGIARIPNDTRAMGLTTRYKVRMNAEQSGK